MRLISRYILREAAGATLLVLAVLLLILMSNQLAEILGDAAANQLPRQAVFTVFGLTFLRYLTLLAPIGLFLGVMLALARLNRDSEMAALSACGVGPLALLKPVGLLTAVVAGLVTWLALVEMPNANRRIEQIRFEARERLGISTLESGRFMSPDSGRTVLYAQEVRGDELHDVFLQRDDGERVAVILAERGERVQDPATGALSFVLYDGRRYAGEPGEKRFFIAEFGAHNIPVDVGGEDEFVEEPVAKPTAELIGASDPLDRAELQWRLSAPVSLLVLAVLAVPLSRSSPREGRYARLGVALLLYIVYVNLLSIARVWMERGQVPEWIGLWWVHAAFGLAAAYLVARAAGAFVRTAPYGRIEPVHR